MSQSHSHSTKKTFSSHDGLKLHYQYNQAQVHEKAILIIVHGLNEHLGRYQHVVDHFIDHFSSYRFDFRGHGASPGKRSHVNSFDDLVLDLKTFVDFVAEQEPNKKIFLIGHSMGGQIVLNSVGRFAGQHLTGFITSSPNIRIAFKISALERALARFLNRYLPTLPLPNHVKADDLSHDPLVIKMYNSDALVNKTLTARFGHSIVKNQEEDLLPLAKNIHLPAFMMHSGADNVCAKEGTIDFFNLLASKDKTLKIYEGCYHELFNDFAQHEVFSDMNRWLLRHC